MRPTLFILGAGASAPYGFPSGRKLKLEIAKHINSIVDPLRENRIRRSAVREEFPVSNALLDLFDLNHVEEFGRALSRSYQPSVDYFIEHRPKFTEVGKASIAAALTPYEDDETLFSSLEGMRWYEYLYQRISTTPDDFANSNVSFVTFNYDRSLERFLYVALKNSHGLTPDETEGVMRHLPLVHVHGQLGPLRGNDEERRISYNREVSQEVVRERAKYISIMPEALDDSPSFGEARELISQARRICFLGFGYGERNLRRLKLKKYGAADKEVIGTAYDLREAERGSKKAIFTDLGIIHNRPRKQVIEDSGLGSPFRTAEPGGKVVFGNPTEGNLDFLRRAVYM